MNDSLEHTYKGLYVSLNEMHLLSKSHFVMCFIGVIFSHFLTYNIFNNIYFSLHLSSFYTIKTEYMPPWRNRLARSAINRKVGGSSPPGGAKFF